MESSKQAWLKKQRSLRDKASGNKSKEVQALNKQLQAALQVLDVERYHVAACEEAAMTAEKGHGRHALFTHVPDSTTLSSSHPCTAVMLCCQSLLQVHLPRFTAHIGQAEGECMS